MVKPKLVTLLVLSGPDVDGRIAADNELFAEYISTMVGESGKVDVIVAHAEDYTLNPKDLEDAGASSDQDQS